MKTRDEVLSALSSRRTELEDRFGVVAIALFGSVGRGDASDASDLDLLVDFNRPVTLFDLAALEEYLSESLGFERVDVVLRNSILPALRESILRDAIDVR